MGDHRIGLRQRTRGARRRVEQRHLPGIEIGTIVDDEQRLARLLAFGDLAIAGVIARGVPPLAGSA